VYETLRTKKVKLQKNLNSSAKFIEVRLEDIARIESGLVYWGTDALPQGYGPKGTRLILAKALFPTGACWQEHTNFGLPDPLHPLPYEGVYEPLRPEPTSLTKRLSKEVIPEDLDSIYRDDPNQCVWVPGDTLPTPKKDDHGEPTGEFERASVWTNVVVPRRGRPLIKPASSKEDPECLRNRAVHKPVKLKEVKTHDEYDEEGRTKRTNAYPPGDRHRGWWACSVLVPKEGTKLQTLTKTEVIVICWVQQMQDDEWITAWTITATNTNTGADREIGGGWWAAPLDEEEENEEEGN
jgi:hypothetical protein